MDKRVLDRERKRERERERESCKANKCNHSVLTTVYKTVQQPNFICSHLQQWRAVAGERSGKAEVW